MTKDPRTKLGTEREVRSLLPFRRKSAADRVIAYLKALPPADPRLR